MEDIIIRGVSKRYGNREVLKDVSLKIKRGSFFTFLGPSGCGKTTLLRILAGFTEIDSGDVYLGGKRLNDVAPEKRGIGMVFQNYALFPHMTVYENVSYGLKVKRTPKKESNDLVGEYLELVGLEGYQERRVSELSGGEQQRVALARTLIVKPKVLLLDEPLSNLDAKLRVKMRNDLRRLQKKLGITTIFVTHDQEEALTSSHEIAVFREGECIQAGTPRDIYINPKNRFIADFVGEVNLFSIKEVTKEGVASVEGGIKLLKKGAADMKYISIRPEQVVLSKNKKGSLNEFNGVVEGVEFNGRHIRYTLSINKTEIAAINPFDLMEEEFKRGEKVYIELREEALKCFSE